MKVSFPTRRFEDDYFRARETRPEVFEHPLHECNRFDSGCHCFRISIISPFPILASGWLLCRRPNFRPRAFRRRFAETGVARGQVGKVAPLVCYARRSPPLVNALKLHAFRIQGRNSRETAARCCSPNYTESLFFGRATRERKRNYGIRFVGGKREESGKLCRDTVGVSWIRNIYFNPIRCVLCSFGSPVTTFNAD